VATSAATVVLTSCFLLIPQKMDNALFKRKIVSNLQYISDDE
jgi:hypothetical protein